MSRRQSGTLNRPQGVPAITSSPSVRNCNPGITLHHVYFLEVLIANWTTGMQARWRCAGKWLKVGGSAPSERGPVDGRASVLSAEKPPPPWLHGTRRSPPSLSAGGRDRYGRISLEELELRKADLAGHSYRHLPSLSGRAQFIVIETTSRIRMWSRHSPTTSSPLIPH
jgi:hypothetical protein